ncbi:DUF4367 domain-containing protein [Paenibacillaceae bacterium]|nr:DUF4367 domain-containing protein [Paenibacillaceae bacterium]
MRRMKWIAAIIVCVTVLITGCGTKDADSVVKDLNKIASNVASYKGNGTMTLYTGQQPIEYKVEVWYEKPQHYRIALTNEEKDITQIVLRNDDGVFVLTPRLNKSFRFQSDWPDNQGQVYLYQTLVQSIVKDNSRQFVTENDAYVFDVMAEYQNGSFARQKIWLNKNDYAPLHVQVSDSNAAVMVEVKFDNFEFDAKFDGDAFNMERNMGTSMNNEQQPSAKEEGQDVGADPEDQTTGGQETGTEANNDNDEQGTDETGGEHNQSAHEDDEGEPGDQTNDKEGSKADDSAAPESEGTTAPTEAQGGEADSYQFVEGEPTYYPTGAAFKDMSYVTLGDSDGVMYRYTGSYDYTLIQTTQKDRAMSLVPGYLVQLGHTVGVMTGDELLTLTWTYEGTEYRLTSASLPEDEMIKVAQSVQVASK